MIQVEFILYVNNQQASRDFYAQLLDVSPSLDVPGMTEFNLNENCKLGLMPNNGIAKILADKTPHPNTGSGIPRCELYLHFTDIHERYDLAISLGAKAVSPVIQRDWGDKVGYLADMDGHIIALATTHLP